MRSKQRFEEEDQEIKSLLEEKFGQILNDEEVPEDLKEEVFSSINSLVLLGDLTDLFTIKFAKTKFSAINPFGKGGMNPSV